MVLSMASVRRERIIACSSLWLVLTLLLIVEVRTFVISDNAARSKTTSLFASSTTEDLLCEYGFGRRLRTLLPSDLPLTAELHDHGTWELCRIVKLEPPTKSGAPPRIQVELDDDMVRIVDLGQVTTVWESEAVVDKAETSSYLDSLSLQQREQPLQKLYHNFSQRARNSKGGLTKKQVKRIVPDGPDQAHCEDVFRKALKSGEGMVRLVDSALAMDYIYDDYPRTEKEASLRRTVGGHSLAQDAELGGRFKRMPCIFVGAESDEKVDSLTFLNGGWLVVDESSRAGAEARKFAQRSQNSQILTEADVRIAHRLECLAMGEVFGAVSDENELEVDVRETLVTMNLPTTPEGAQQALVSIGRWSEDQKVGNLQPWSKETLLAAKTYAQADMERRKQLTKSSKVGGDDMIEGRVDLTNIPSICIDAKSTTFRDDAIGIRPRSSTGRKVIPEASKFEVLIHIADVSDIYLPDSSVVDVATTELLRKAAISRGMSRYDLPLGPLHLMPPIALKSLGFFTSNGSKKSIPNRCVTMWAYIDERNGKVLDVGLERTLISSPLALSYDVASDYLHNREKMGKDDPAARPAAILSLVERSLRASSKQRKQSSEAARKREARLAAKEVVSGGFQRTRGHRLVDMALDLYGAVLSQLLQKHKAPVPRASGSGASRAGRVATAPLRRLVDGMAQRQALAVLCNYGGNPLTADECREINEHANEAMNRLANIRPLKQKGASLEEQRALAQLKRSGKKVVTAIGTGRGNEISIQGAVGKCQGMRGSLKPGQKISVRIRTLNVDKGILKVELAK